MKPVLASILVTLAACASVVPAERALPLADGQYTFQHRYAEQPDMELPPVIVTIHRRHITLVNPKSDGVLPAGVIEEGELMWHAATAEWIIGESEDDRSAPEVGGCSDGPEVVDLDARVYWTC